MISDPLAHLTKDERIKGAFNGNILYEGRQLGLHVNPDGSALSECLELAKAALAQLARLDEMARKEAVRKLLSNYNENWREYQRGDGKGGVVDVSNPELTEEEFISQIVLTSVEFTGNEQCCLGYDDGGLFAGHAIFVRSFDGEGFSDFYVELFG